ncbi:hypothetical protein DL96DRAFT_1603170 [Flagelloscypha sp. PMI_526]|nr:hypothetical protein DL96DRAFT_1603170 [Flagelloscypha sp. PMI_526]
MAFRFAGRLPGLRALMPRVTAPLLPTSLRATSVLTRTSRPTSQARLFQNFSTRLADTSPETHETHSLPKDATLSQRLKHLIKSYGWYALGVYIVLSVVDFSVAFAAVNLLGAEQVSVVTSNIKTFIYGFIHTKPPEPGKDEMETSHSSSEGLYAMLVLAYTIHKTLFFPVRVGLTAGLTPRLVNWLRTRGWAGGAGTRRAAEEMRERLRNRRNRD